MNPNEAKKLGGMMAILSLGEQPSQLRVKALEDFRRLRYLAEQTPLLKDDPLH